MKRAAAIGVIAVAVLGSVIYGITLGLHYYNHHHGDWRIGLAAVGIGAAPVAAASAACALVVIGVRLLVAGWRVLPGSALRFPIAIGVIAVTWAAAAYVHARQVTTYSGGTCVNSFGGPVSPDPILGQLDAASCRAIQTGNRWEPTPIGMIKPAWETPVTILLALGGVAVAVGIATAR